jgi:arginine/lysine/ornithine decarboxylase
MTQASMLHAQGNQINFRALTNALKVVQTTSPSYILMASLDLARMQMATEGAKLLEKTIKLAEEARLRINRIPGVSCFGKTNVTGTIFSKMGDLDVTKLTVTVKELGLSGYRVSQILNSTYNIQVEMADPFHILVIVSIGDRRDDLNRLVDALKEISKNNPPKAERSPLEKVDLPLFQNKVQTSSHKAFFSKHEYLNLPESIGRVSSEIVTVYPPGIPVLIPGEVITQEVIDYIKIMADLGATIDGLNESNTLVGVVTTS